MRFSLAEQIGHELRALTQCYPPFVVGRERDAVGGYVPVFVYHTIDPVSFDRDLRFLADNGYTTIGMRDLTRHMAEGRGVPEKAVVLTFDDARSSFWRYAYPLLQRHQMRGVLFVIAGLTPEAAAVRENLSAAGEARRTLEEIDALDPEDTTLCTWTELRAMYDSGYVEVESHSLFHREVFVDTDVLDILGPESSFTPYQTSATAYLKMDDIGRPIEPELFYGLPVLRAASLHAGERAWVVPEDIRVRARTLWRESPAEARADGSWKKAAEARWTRQELRRHLRRQTDEEVREAISCDIGTARTLIKERLGPEAGDHFCLPYGVGSEESILAQRRLGLQSCAWGAIPGRRHNGPGVDPMRICRLKADFLWRLPGDGRKSLSRVYADKLGRRFRGERVY